MFERYADGGTLLELYDRAVAEREDCAGARGSLEKRAALAERLSELERRGYLRQAARGVLSDAELDDLLAEVEGQRRAVAEELRHTEVAAAAERLRTARASLASYDPIHSEWPEDPDAIHPGQFLTLGATPEQIRRDYRRYGARFEVDSKGGLALRLAPRQGQGVFYLAGQRRPGGPVMPLAGAPKRRDPSPRGNPRSPEYPRTDPCTCGVRAKICQVADSPDVVSPYYS